MPFADVARGTRDAVYLAERESPACPSAVAVAAALRRRLLLRPYHVQVCEASRTAEATTRSVIEIRTSRPLSFGLDAEAAASAVPIARTPCSRAPSVVPAWSGPRKARRIRSRS